MKYIIMSFCLISSFSSTGQIKLKDTVSESRIKLKNKISLRHLIIPVGLITYGAIAIENNQVRQLDKSTESEIKGDHPNFNVKIDNYIQYSPAFAVYGLNALGIKGKNNFRDRTMIYAMSTLISSTFVITLKKITNVQRPDASGFNSFPSGHTTTAFAAAEFLRQEYKDVSPWYGIAGYTVAATTGILRLYNNKHWVSDVVAGAGFGILSTKLAYWIYPTIKRTFFKNKSLNTMVTPFYQNGRGGVAIVYSFKH